MEGQRRSFTEDYKRQAVDLVASSGRSIGSVAKELGLRDSVLRRWAQIAGAPSRGREWDLSGSQTTHPVPLPRSKTPAGPTLPRHYGRIKCCPRCRESKGSSVSIISRLQRGFGTCCLRFKSGVATATCKTRFRLAG